MGFFGKLFEKKNCDICGGEIGLLGNRKLEDGNCCKDCAKKLSPWFDDRRHSTIQEIQEQLAYREANKAAVAAFRSTHSYGCNWQYLHIDKNSRKFLITEDSSDFRADNPDVLDFSQVTSVEFRPDEFRTEVMRVDSEGNEVSYVPRRYEYSYDFHLKILVDHPYFSEMKMKMNNDSICVTPPSGIREFMDPDCQRSPDYREYERMGQEIVELLTSQPEPVPAAAPGAPKFCPECGSPVSGGKFCMNCGRKLM